MLSVLFWVQERYIKPAHSNSISIILIQILDLMGRETTFKPNTTLIYIYDDGSIEKVFSVEY